MCTLSPVSHVSTYTPLSPFLFLIAGFFPLGMTVKTAAGAITTPIGTAAAAATETVATGEETGTGIGTGATAMTTPGGRTTRGTTTTTIAMTTTATGAVEAMTTTPIAITRVATTTGTTTASTGTTGGSQTIADAAGAREVEETTTAQRTGAGIIFMTTLTAYTIAHLYRLNSVRTNSRVNSLY